MISLTDKEKALIVEADERKKEEGRKEERRMYILNLYFA